MKSSPSSASSPNSSSGETLFLEFRERVRYSETDKMGVAHNKSYFEWFELGRTEYCRRAGLPYGEVEARGFFLMVAEASCRYRKPLRYDEEILIRVSLSEAEPRRLVFRYELAAAADGRLVATGQTVHVPTNARAEVCSLPPDILDKLKGAVP